MIHIRVIPMAPLGTNCYVVYDEEGDEAFVVDPGAEPQRLLETVGERQVTHILLTHTHWDHIAGLQSVWEATDATVYVHPLEREWLTDPALNLSNRGPLGDVSVHIDADALQAPPDRFELLGQSIEVLPTPGHSPGHVTYAMGDVLFGGDVLFRGSIGRTDIPGGDGTVLLQSIRTQLFPFPDETTVLPGHGPTTTIGEEKRTNPFLL